jgi:hypothetical protein
VKSFLLVFLLVSNYAFAEIGFVEKTFLEFVTGRTPTSDSVRDFPVYVQVPESFVVRGSVPKVEGVLIADPEDLVRAIDAMDYSVTEKGIFRAAVSTSTAYYIEKDKFSGEDDLQSTKQLEKYGMTNVQVKRLNSSIPMLLTTAEKDSRKTFLLNVAIARPASTTMKIFFYQSKTRSKLDDEIVSRFVKSLSKE